MDHVVLVDDNDHATGSMEKLEAHRLGLLHRAFSVFIFNSRGEMLLQQRAEGKYHSAGLWSNACCSHPRPGEEVKAAAHRRLREEMGFDANLKHKTVFRYRAEFPNGLIEHEVDHVFTGQSDEPTRPNPSEVKDYKWITSDLLKDKLRINEGLFTKWFVIAMKEVFSDWSSETRN
jgi:isopentenyl-diphosphate Delta-isomerase